MNIKIAILSGYGTPTFRGLAREVGCEHYFVKPLDPKQLDVLFSV
jgi:YesN/AraC family two-component response regulator